MRFTIMAGTAAIAAILVYLIYWHDHVNALEERIFELEELHTLTQQRIETSFALCVNIIESMERRQRSVENIIVTNDNLNLTLRKVRAYNIKNQLETPQQQEAMGGEP